MEKHALKKYEVLRCIVCEKILCTREEEQERLCNYHHKLKLEKEAFSKLQLHRKFEYLFDKMVESGVINV